MKSILLALMLMVLLSCKQANSNNSHISQDNIAPLIHIKGLNPVKILQHSIYKDAGAVAIDDMDKEVEVYKKGEVNTAVPGVYRIFYSAKDKSGNRTIVSREVIVIEDEAITHNGTVYGVVVSPYTGRVWLDRNLGAMRVCTGFDDILCYGDYYQWGRNYDGHQDKDSLITTTLANDVNRAGSYFIKSPDDWTSSDSSGDKRSSNWAKTDGSSICPFGFRVPTLEEFKAEFFDENSSKIQGREDAFRSFLALPSAGLRVGSGGNMLYVGVSGFYRTLSRNSLKVSSFLFGEAVVEANKDGNNLRAVALSIRCIQP